MCLTADKQTDKQTDGGDHATHANRRSSNKNGSLNGARCVFAGFTQLKVVEASMLGQLLGRSLPRHWRQAETTVEWTAGQKSQPYSGWLEALWNYLKFNCPYDLKAVETFPLIPVRSPRKQMIPGIGVTLVTELVPLAWQGALLIRRADGISLGAELELIATKLGMTVVDTPPHYIRGHMVVEMDYLFAPTYMGMLRAVQRQCERTGRDKVVEHILQDTTLPEKRRLRELLAKISPHELHEEYHDLLAHLPLFETLDNSGNLPSHFVSAAQVRLAAPAERTSITVSQQMLDVTSADSQTLAQLLSIRRLEPAQLLTEVVFWDLKDGFHDSASVRRIMLYVIRNYHRLAESDTEFQQTLRSLAFVDMKGTLMPAERFYDPADDLLRRMFVLQDKFPPSPYTDAASVSVLRDLGLRTVSDVDAADVREAALCISQLLGEKSSVDRLCDKSAAIFDYIQRHPNQLTADSGDGVPLGEALANIPWARRATARPKFYPSVLTWYSDPRPFYRPAEMSPRSLASAVGSVKPVAIMDISEPVQKSFGWDQPPPISSVVDHLVNTISSYSGRDKALYAEIVRSIYAELSRVEDPNVVYNVLSERGISSWIWHGDGYAAADRVVFVPPSFMDLRPFIYGVPVEMLPFSDLLIGAGVTQTARLADVLLKVRLKHDNPVPVASTKASPHQASVEMKRDLHVCVSVLNELKSQILAGCCESELDTLHKDLCLPVQTDDRAVLKLAPLAECTYCDEEWLRQG